MNRYEAWTAQFAEDSGGRIRGRCADATRAMVETFPELRRAAGFVHTMSGCEMHWWCVTPDGVIVDPTRAQFYGPIDYEELDLSQPADQARVPTGRCLHCGEYAFNEQACCSDACTQAAARALNRS